MSSRPRLAQLFIWQGWTLLAALVPSLTVSLLWTPGTLLWKLATVLWVILWGLRLAVWLPVRFFRLGYQLEADRLLVTDGVLFPTVRIFPLAALQTAAVSADPLQRLLQPVGACPEHRGLRRAPAHAALRMRRIREHAHRRETRLHARLLHDDETASAAANLAGDGVCFPPFFLQGFNLLRDHFP